MMDDRKIATEIIEKGSHYIYGQGEILVSLDYVQNNLLWLLYPESYMPLAFYVQGDQAYIRRDDLLALLDEI
jgi:hypothetical protein